MNLLYIGGCSPEFERLAFENKLVLIKRNNGLEAIKELNENKTIDLIICEYNLPGNHGIYFHDKIKESSKFSEIPFILLVKGFNKSVLSESFEKGISDYFVLDESIYEQIFSRIKMLLLKNKESFSNEEISKEIPVYKFPISKRLFDIFSASFILLILSPILIITVLAIKLESKGKVYYIAKRVGRKTFDFYKLRSMRTGSDKLLNELAQSKNQYNNTEELDKEMDVSSSCPRCKKLPSGKYCSPLNYEGVSKICDYWHTFQKNESRKKKASFIKIVDDPRITKVGKLIRNTSMDELPQLINVIKGDMSLVGNRPLPVYEAELLTQDQMSKRFLAPAGITGLWQVELRGKGGDMSEEERIALDNKYADYFSGNNYSLWFDIQILLRTIPALFQKSTV